MGFKYDTSQRRDKNAPRKASGIGMILVFVVLGVAIWACDGHPHAVAGALGCARYR